MSKSYNFQKGEIRCQVTMVEPPYY